MDISFTITLNYWNITFILLGLVVAVSYVVRYHLLRPSSASSLSASGNGALFKSSKSPSVSAGGVSQSSSASANGLSSSAGGSKKSAGTGGIAVGGGSGVVSNNSSTGSLASPSKLQLLQVDDDDMPSAGPASASTTATGMNGNKKSRYLPEEIFASFLSTIKIFQYIEKHILLEFAKNSQQMKVYPGEIVWDSSHKDRNDLYLVMDGCVQILMASSASSTGATSTNAPKNLFATTPVAEFKSASDGGLEIDVLNLPPPQSPRDASSANSEHTTSLSPSDVNNPIMSPSVSSNDEDLPLDDAQVLNEVYEGGTASSLFDILDIYAGSDGEASSAHHHVPPHVRFMSPMSINYLATTTPATVPNQHIIIARALTESTLMVIPEATFRRIAQHYPNAASQIVQIIITRFQRVTATTLHRYLGLSEELYRIEKSVNETLSTRNEDSGSLLQHDELERVREIWKLNKAGQSSTSTSTGANSEVFSKSRKSSAASSYESLAESMRGPSRALFAGSHQEILGSSQSSHSRRSDAPIQTAHHDMPRKYSMPNTQLSKGKLASALSLSSSGKDGLLERPLLSEREIKQFLFDKVAKSLGFSFMQPSQPPSSIMERRKMPHWKTSQSEMNSPVSSPVTSRQQLTPTFSSKVDLVSELQIMNYDRGDVVVKHSELNMGVYLVVDGALDVYGQSLQRDRGAFDKKVGTIWPGCMVGYFSSLTGHPSFLAAKARKPTIVAYLAKSHLDYMIERCPNIMVTFAQRLKRRASPLVRNIDLAMDWAQINAGQVLYVQNEPKSEFIYIILNGRLRTIQENSSTSKEVSHEYGQGESIGEVEVLTRSARSNTVHAVRDTELACIPQTLFHLLALKYPEVTIHVSRLLASRGQKMLDPPPNLNLKTIALLPTHADVPILEFAERLLEAVKSIGESAIVLDGGSVTNVLGRHAFTRMGKLKLLSWLTEQEEKARLVLYTVDTGPTSPWTLRCIRQADCILVVGLANVDPSCGEYEKTMMRLIKTSARKELVLLHSTHYTQTGVANDWLAVRPWIYRHHHVHMPSIVTKRYPTTEKQKTALEDLKSRFEKFAQFYYIPKFKVQQPLTSKQKGNRNDFARLARRLTGKSIGLALGGGGARGIAHIGVLRAFHEAGIPIDIVGGVSIGALIGGLYSLHEDIWYVYWRAKEFSMRASSIWRQILDLTYPIAAWFTGHEFNRGIWKCFGLSQIEDTWINFICLTTNITHSRLEVHSTGMIWRFVRASMSLSGYLPPLCDNGDMLLDGGYLNNLPGDVIRSRGADTVIAVDVSSDDNVPPALYGDTLSGVWALFSQYNPFSRDFVPTLADIQSRLAYVSCAKQLEDVKNMDRCFYLRPPVAHYGTLEFQKFDEIFETGYQYGLQIVKAWEEEGTLAKWQNVTKKRKARPRRNSI